MAGKKVLVVDDEKLIVKGIRFSLEQDNMEVDCAYDGEEALQMAHNKEYDIILLDVMLPKLTGFEVCQQIREFSNVPVIMLTAAVPYNKKVTIFPCQSAPCTFPVFRITRHPLTTIYSSLPAIITIKRSTCGKRVNRQINIAACVSLSATGSSIFPKLLILWNLLAIYPSARSVRPDSNKISPANRGFFFTQ